MYDITSGKWTLITEDSGAMGGPSLIFDHQMVMDVDKQHIYVFGGRVLSWYVLILAAQFGHQTFWWMRWSLPIRNCLRSMLVSSAFICPIYLCSTDGERSLEAVFSGLFSYHIPTNTWTRLRADGSELKSRIGHSMLFHPVSTLYYTSCLSFPI